MATAAAYRVSVMQCRTHYRTTFIALLALLVVTSTKSLTAAAKCAIWGHMRKKKVKLRALYVQPALTLNSEARPLLKIARPAGLESTPLHPDPSSAGLALLDPCAHFLE